MKEGTTYSSVIESIEGIMKLFELSEDEKREVMTMMRFRLHQKEIRKDRKERGRK